MTDMRYLGRSLAFFRRVLGVHTIYGSCNDAMGHTTIDSRWPESGEIVWFNTGHYGDMGVMVDDNLVLMLDVKGQPVLRNLNTENYIGCSKTIGDLDDETI